MTHEIDLHELAGKLARENGQFALDEENVSVRGDLLAIPIKMSNPEPDPVLIIVVYDTGTIIFDVRRIFFMDRGSPLVQLNKAIKHTFTDQNTMASLMENEGFSEYSMDLWTALGSQAAHTIAEGHSRWEVVHFLSLLHLQELSNGDACLMLDTGSGELYLRGTREHAVQLGTDGVLKLAREHLNRFHMLTQFHNLCHSLLVPAPFKPHALNPLEFSPAGKDEEAPSMIL